MKRRSSVEYRRRQLHQLQQLTDCDIVKRGTLYVKHPPSFLPAALSIQAWKKRYIVLRDTWYCSPCVVTSLDIYDSEPPSLETGLDYRRDSGSGGPQSLVGRHDPYTVDLRQLTAVEFHLESRRFQFAFYVERCDGRPLLFAAESDLEMRCWVAALRMLADKARVGVKTSLDSRRSISTASPGSRRCTVPLVDVGVPLSLDRRRRNLSDSHLHAVPAVLRRYAHPSPCRFGQSHVGLNRKLTASDVGQSHLSSTLAMSSLNEADAESLVPAHSPDGAAAADSDGHSPLRRMFLASVLGTLLRREVGGGHGTALSKDQRKDSGFSESFDDGSCDSEPSTQLDSLDMRSSPPRPATPPRPPPRRTTVVSDRSTTTTPLTSRHPPPPPPPLDVDRDGVDWPEPAPPTPPPRPPHTLLAFSSAGVL